MSENTVFVKKYEADVTLFPINEKEIWRYAGYWGVPDAKDDRLAALLCEVIKEQQALLSYKVCYRRMPLAWVGDMPQLPFQTTSQNLAQCLRGSSQIILFAATIGLLIDRSIAKYQRLAPTKALLLQAYGAERIECLCDVFCREMKEMAMKEKLTCTARYSPGYGDLPLNVQRDVFRLLDCNRQIGISLNENLLMTPSKSVTAIFGLGECVGRKRAQKEDVCDKEKGAFQEQA